jgi:hypothetical protein
MGALRSLAAGPAVKVDASRIAEIEIRAVERVIRSADARVELLRRFFIFILGGS